MKKLILQMIVDSNLNARDLDSSSVQSLTAIINNDLPVIGVYARGLLLKGRHIEYTETVAFPTGVKSYPAYYYLGHQKFDFPEEKHLFLFPNPCGDFVIAYFNAIEKSRKGTIKINDLQGKELDRIQLGSQQNQIVINLSNYPNGIYIVQLFNENQPISSKLLVKGRK